MTDAVISAHKTQLIAGLKYLYGTGTLTRPGTRTSNGRGGFTTTPADPEPIWLQRETDTRMLDGHNVKPDQALIFILNTLAEPKEGNVVESALVGRWSIKDVTLDPVTAVYHCRCDRV